MVGQAIVACTIVIVLFLYTHTHSYANNHNTCDYLCAIVIACVRMCVHACSYIISDNYSCRMLIILHIVDQSAEGPPPADYCPVIRRQTQQQRLPWHAPMCVYYAVMAL